MDDEQFLEELGLAMDGTLIASGLMIVIMFAKRGGVPDQQLRDAFEQQLIAANALEDAVRSQMTPEQAGQEAMRQMRKAKMTIVKDPDTKISEPTKQPNEET